MSTPQLQNKTERAKTITPERKSQTPVNSGPEQDVATLELQQALLDSQVAIQPETILRLQRMVGNHATQQLIQRKETPIKSALVNTAVPRPGTEIVQRTYAKGSAAEDAKLFEKATPIPDDQITPLPAAATRLGITSTNLGHYLERHTYKYQKLNAKTVSPAATLFPHGTTAENIKDWVKEALGLVKDTDTIGASPVSLAVDLANGIKVNLGALKNNQLAAFFPLSGTGVQDYTSEELKAIRDERNKTA